MYQYRFGHRVPDLSPKRVGEDRDTAARLNVAAGVSPASLDVAAGVSPVPQQVNFSVEVAVPGCSITLVFFELRFAIVQRLQAQLPAM